MQMLSSHYAAHINVLQSRTRKLLAKCDSDYLAIHAGVPLTVFLDDYSYPFKVNPHFKAWLPVVDVPDCWLVVNGEGKPKLYYFQPVDFWHKVIPLAEDYWTQHFEIEVVKNRKELSKALAVFTNNASCISEHQALVNEIGFKEINAKIIIDYLHYHRAYKTDYEHECLRRSNAIAITGHHAAKEAFYEGQCEYEIYLAYLKASQQIERETPYGSIVALNENAAILHYTHFNRTPPNQSRSFLIDAGATFHGYASDITRTYSFEENDFSSLIKGMHLLMQEAAAGLGAGNSYIELHSETYYNIAKLLKEFKVINVSPEEACELEIVSTFFPHGLGHHLGLQTHDVAGFMHDESGTHKNVPKKFSALRVSRKIEARQVFTIEPGLYFIDSLLNDLKASTNKNKVNWDVIERFRPYGGIRIEDNIIVHGDHNENMTRDAGLN